MLLSQRGELYAEVAKDRSLFSELKQVENLPTWTDWYEV